MEDKRASIWPADASNFLVTSFDDIVDVQITLMTAPCVITADTVNLAKHTLAEAFERERMQATQNLPVSFRDPA